MSDIFAGSNFISIDVTNRAGDILGSGPLISCVSLTYTRRLDNAGEFTAVFPHNDPQVLRLVRVKSRKFYIYVNSVLRLIGIPEKLNVTMGPDGRRMVTISGRDHGAELAEYSVGYMDLSDGSGGGIDDGPEQIAVAAGWLVSGATTTATDVYAKFAGESALSALIKISEKIGEHFYIHPTLQRVVWLGTETPDSGLVAIATAGEPALGELNPNVCFIQQFGEQTDGYELATRIYAYGTGSGDTRLTLGAATNSPPLGFTLDSDSDGYYVESDSAAAEFGAEIVAHREFKDIRPLSNTNADLESAGNFLLKAALEWLKLRDSVDDVVDYTLGVVGLNNSANPGSTIRVEYQDEFYLVDSDLVMLEIAMTINQAGTQLSRLSVAPVSRRLRSDDAYIDSKLEQGQVYSAYPQVNGNSYEMPFRVFVGESQTDAKAEIRFTFRDDVVQVLQVLFRFSLEELVNTTTTVSSSSTSSGASSITSSGASSASSSAAGSSHSHTVTIPDHDHDIPDHQHVVGLSQGSGGANVGVFTGSGSMYYEGADVGVVEVLTTSDSGGTTSDDGGGSTPTSSSEGAHTHDIAHTHNVEHTHEVTPDIDTAVGIFREEAANTYGINDLQYQINGGGWAALSGATLITSSTYELDITADLVDGSNRPDQENNLIEVRHDGGGGAKTVMLDVLLAIRTKIQSINYQ